MAPTKRFDPARFLDDEEMISGYLQRAVESGDKEHLLACLSDALRARSINQLALDTGIGRKKLCDIFLSSGLGQKPSKTVIVKVAKAIIRDPQYA